MSQLNNSLNDAQKSHVQGVEPVFQKQMEKYLMAGADVFISFHCEGDDIPPVAIVVNDGTGFWIDCATTVEDGINKAKSLGLNVILRPATLKSRVEEGVQQ